ncbi:hypothetical protein BDN72DRAFT_640665 [Pluteus cervinus]|uniref:Uncharacterized protein n=1 Tax=Pluteus cervinus TaxID=181527 RepID=A0ACD3A0D5_9AGAR|nr:hypothetical protein BDN72DRAFT_640665 [Pluteus cervinus]
MTTLTLRCYIWGEPSNRVFDLEIKNEVYIAHLRETIRKKKELPVNRSLVLFKVAISHMNVRLGFRVRGTPNDLDGAILLLPEQELADIFKLGDSLNPQEIHIIVMEWCRGMVPLTLTKFYPRAELVKALYNKLSTERFVQVLSNSLTATLPNSLGSRSTC